MVDRYRRSALRLRFIHDDVSLNQLHTDTYYEFGDFIDGEFKVSKNEKDEASVVIELEREGSIKDPESNERNTCTIIKTIMIEKDRLLIALKGTFNEISGKEELLKRILENLYLAIDIPFFFNGDTNKFKWESAYIEFANDKEKDL
ncbi:unnamed protein product, partial [marine sediment metagenome]